MKNTGGGIVVDLTLHATTPWFESWRDMFLDIQYPSDHEFTKHYVACIIVSMNFRTNDLYMTSRIHPPLAGLL